MPSCLFTHLATPGAVTPQLHVGSTLVIIHGFTYIIRMEYVEMLR
jgi:hypothetical protein